MKLLPESNSLHKVNMKEKISKPQLIKRIAITLLVLFGTGFVFQLIYNFYSNEKISSRMMYTRINEKKMEFNTGGKGDYTVIFDGAIGGNAYEWDTVCKKVQEKYGLKTFVYNRQGYGFSDIGDSTSPKQQAEDLKILLRKAAVGGPYILVGEGYGSLVMTNFAKLYPESVKGIVLLNPIDEELLKSNGSSKESIPKLIYEKFQALGSRFSLTLLLDKLGLATKFSDFENGLKLDYQKEEYEFKKNQSDYRQAIYNETNNIYNAKSDSQTDGMFKDIPLYIISNKDDETLKRLGSENLTTVYKTSYAGNFLSIKESNNVSTAIGKVLEQASKIERKNKENK